MITYLPNTALDNRYTTWGVVRPFFAVQLAASVTIGTANSCWYYRVIDSAIISKIRLSVAVTSGNIAVAAYANSGSGLASVPGTRLAASGSVACPTAGVSDTSLGASIQVNPGDWLAVAADNITATFSGITGVGGGTFLTGMVFNQLAAFPCPITPASLVAGNNRLIGCLGVP